MPEGAVVEALAIPDATAAHVEDQPGREHQVQVCDGDAVAVAVAVALAAVAALPGLRDAEGAGDELVNAGDVGKLQALATHARIRTAGPTLVAVVQDRLEIRLVPDGRKQSHPRRRLVPGLPDEPAEDPPAGLPHKLLIQRVPPLARQGPQDRRFVANRRFVADSRVRACLTASSAGPVRVCYAGASSFVVLPTRTDSSSR